MILEALACAVVDVGLSPEAFGALTVSEWQAIVERFEASWTRDYRTTWEQTRTLVYAALAPHLKEGVTLREVMPLPWDEAPQKPQLPTAEERAEMLRRYS